MEKLVRIVIGETVYNSYTDIARDFGLRPGVISKRFRQGCTKEELTREVNHKRSHSTKPIPVTINNKYFPSISAAARYYNIAPASFYLAVCQAMRDGTDLFASNAPRKYVEGKRICKPVTIYGVTYPSMTIAAEKLGVPYNTFASRVKSGYYLDQNDANKPLCFEFDGKWYKNRDACAEAHGVSAKELRYRMHLGISFEDAIDPERYNEAREAIVKERTKARIERRDARRAKRAEDKTKKIVNPKDNSPLPAWEAEYNAKLYSELSATWEDDFESTFA